MSRFSRINTIWRKELVDTLRDRRTLVAMVLVPMVLYPMLILGSLQALEVQVSYLVADKYTLAVSSDDAARWLRRVIDSDPARRIEDRQGAAAEEIAERAADAPVTPPDSTDAGASLHRGGADTAKQGVREHPPAYEIIVVDDVSRAVFDGQAQVGVAMEGPPPAPDSMLSTPVTIYYDESDIRSEIAASGIEGVLTRVNERMLLARLSRKQIAPEYLHPIVVRQHNVADAQRMTGSVLGQVLPLILIVMTFTGAIYPAIDLTAGERERGTLETLMVAPVPTVDLIAGKFVVVTLVGLLSALLNLLSMGGTIYLGGVGSILTGGAALQLPLGALPWIFLLLVPLAVMFAAMLLAVCSFARSFKEAQNYIVPVMMAALIPGVVGILPGTRLEGPVLIMPVANIAVLTRELLLGKTDVAAILIVALTTSLYAGAAVAIAARLFGQEAVLFADSGSIKTIFLRRFFKPRPTPSAASALLVLCVVFSLNFFLQNAIGQSFTGLPYLNMVALVLALLLGLGPFLAVKYMRVDAVETFRLRPPPLSALVAAICFGCSTWVLAAWWLEFQSQWFPMDPRMMAELERRMAWLGDISPWTAVFYLAIVPALCEELFFRGYVLSGLRSTLGKGASILIVSLAFGAYHYMAQRLVVTAAIGALLALLVVQYRSIWPAMIAHAMHNCLSQLAGREDALRPLLRSWSSFFESDATPLPPAVVLAAVVAGLGVVLCLTARSSLRNQRVSEVHSAAQPQPTSR
ncbi:MAG: CPBP family intramembrane metalloprotease [Planctomycetota bacterium]|nr:MAG: CPBP family intramembrane metalloprotease [Planctomycetota bacterium]